MNECTNKSKRKKKTMNIEKFEEFISQYPIFEYRILDTKDITIQERVRTICQEECERYDSTWACPPAVGTLQECEKKIKSYPQAVFFSSVAEVSDLMKKAGYDKVFVKKDLAGLDRIVCGVYY